MAKWIETNYGSRRLVLVQTERGAVTCFTTAKSMCNLYGGDTVTLAGTVKGHDLYKGNKQTVLTRVKALG